MTESPRLGLRVLRTSPAVFLALGGGVGLARWAPGTAGSIVGVALALILQELPFDWAIAIWAAMTSAGVWLCDRAGKALGVPDHPAIVWDEICGVALVLLLGPAGLGWIVAGFVAFRFFDILKPWPIHVIDARLPNGFGVMADDVVAALYALATLGLAQWLLAAILGLD